MITTMNTDSSSTKHSFNIRRMSTGYKHDISRDDDDAHVRVAVRCRPLSDKEITAKFKSIVEFESEKRLVVHDVSDSPSVQLGTRSGERRNYSHVYDFDMVFDNNSTQEEIYNKACKPIVASVLEGYNGTILAYGQTGTGKTFTMEGTQAIVNDKCIKDDLTDSKKSMRISDNKTENPGIIPRSFQQIFQHIAKNPEVWFLIRASYVEIYQEEIRDLLRRDKRAQKLELRERADIGVYVKDITSFVCKSIAEIERVMRVGNQNRIVAATDMNEHSSRSHAIFMITIEQQLKSPVQEDPSKDISLIASRGQQQKQVIRVGKLNLVDLAGSERQRKTNSFGQRQRESIKINLSLSALGNVINSLMKVQQSNNSATNTNLHTPYRDSKLTRLLQDSLGGNAKTMMIANIGPASYNYDETINTLNYASRARCIKNKPRLNEDPKDALLRELQQEIDFLRNKLAESSINNVGSDNRAQLRQAKGSDGAPLTERSKQLVEMELHELKQKLSSLEGKLLNGLVSVDQNVLKGLTLEQENELAKRRNELETQVERERAIRDELERRIESELAARQSFETIQQEVEERQRLIKHILLKIKSLRDEIDQTQQSFRVELDELEQLHSVLQRELKLKCLIMDNFIPNCHVDQLLSNIVYDEQTNVCRLLQSLAYRSKGECCYSLASDNKENLSGYWQPTYDSIRPSSEFERMSDAIYPNNIRYKYEELIDPKLRLPQDELCSRQRYLSSERRINKAPSPSIGADESDLHVSMLASSSPTTPRLQVLIDQALNKREPDIVI